MRAIGWLLILGALVGAAMSTAPAPPLRGAALFADRRLSANSDLSCASCHDPARAFGGRGPSLLDLATRHSFGPAPGQSLQAQIAAALRDEQGATPALLHTYGLEWAATVAALEEYINSLSSLPPAPRSAAAQRGATLFGQLGCSGCHRGAALGGDAIVAGGPTSAAPLRVPALQSVALTAPYFRDGSAHDLKAVLALYIAGGQPNAGQALAPLALTPREQRDLLAYLTSLAAR